MTGVRNTRKEIPIGSALQITDGFVEDYARPVAGCELGLADEGDPARLGATHPHPLSYDEAVGVFCQDRAGICIHIHVNNVIGDVFIGDVTVRWVH